MAQTRNVRLNEQIRGTGEAPRINAEAMFLRQPMEAQIRYQRKYITAYDKHHFPAYLVCIRHVCICYLSMSFNSQTELYSHFWGDVCDRYKYHICIYRKDLPRKKHFKSVNKV